MPDFLKSSGSRRIKSAIARAYLKREIEYSEAAVLSTGKAIYVDSTVRDPVTGLYKLYE